MFKQQTCDKWHTSYTRRKIQIDVIGRSSFDVSKFCYFMSYCTFKVFMDKLMDGWIYVYEIFINTLNNISNLCCVSFYKTQTYTKFINYFWKVQSILILVRNSSSGMLSELCKVETGRHNSTIVRRWITCFCFRFSRQDTSVSLGHGPGDTGSETGTSNNLWFPGPSSPEILVTLLLVNHVPCNGGSTYRTACTSRYKSWDFETIVTRLRPIKSQILAKKTLLVLRRHLFMVILSQSVHKFPRYFAYQQRCYHATVQPLLGSRQLSNHGHRSLRYVWCFINTHDEQNWRPANKSINLIYSSKAQTGPAARFPVSWHSSLCPLSALGLIWHLQCRGVTGIFIIVYMSAANKHLSPNTSCDIRCQCDSTTYLYNSHHRRFA